MFIIVVQIILKFFKFMNAMENLYYLRVYLFFFNFTLIASIEIFDIPAQYRNLIYRIKTFF